MRRGRGEKAGKERLRFHLVTALLSAWALALALLFGFGSEAEMLMRSLLTVASRWGDALHQVELAALQVLYSEDARDREALERAAANLDRLESALSDLWGPSTSAEKAARLGAAGLDAFDLDRLVLMERALRGGAFVGSMSREWEEASVQVDDARAVLAPLLAGTWDRDLRPYFAQRIILAFGNLRILTFRYVNLVSEASRSLHTFVLWFEAVCAAVLLALVVWRFARWLGKAEQARAALESEHRKNALTLDLIADAVIAADARGRFVYLNEAAARLFADCGGDVVDIGGLSARLRREDGSPFSLEEELADGSPLRLPVIDLVFEPMPGDARFVTLSHALSSGSGGESQLMIALRDRQRERELLRELELQAFSDPLTSLRNRRKLMSELERIIEGGIRASGDEENRSRAVLMLEDLDRFRMVNEGKSHAAGDRLLMAVADTLRNVTPPGATVARLAGDEFGILLPGADGDYGSQVARRIVSEVGATAIDWQGERIGCSCSVGIAEIPPAHPGGAAEILRRADVACSLAKDAGRSGVQIYRKDDPEALLRDAELDWVLRIREALRSGLFKLYRQEIQSLRGGEGRHWEILVRLVGRDGSVVPPSEFIPVAERTGLIRAIDRWVVTETIRGLSSLGPEDRRRLRHDVFGVNLSGDTVAEAGFGGELLEWLQASGVDPAMLCFEITESAVVRNLGVAASTLSRIQEFGCSLAIDDFGVGQASFGYLRTFPSDYLKIDGSFVRQMGSRPDDAAMVRAMNEVAHILGKRTIAEFVEDSATMDSLGEMGVDFAQGYAIGRPEPLEFAELVPKEA